MPLKNKKNSDICVRLAKAIIAEQQEVIGPVALFQAKQVAGLKIEGEEVSIRENHNPKDVLDQLVRMYAELFGKASIELSKEAVHSLNPPSNSLPDILI